MTGKTAVDQHAAGCAAEPLHMRIVQSSAPRDEVRTLICVRERRLDSPRDSNSPLRTARAETTTELLRTDWIAKLTAPSTNTGIVTFYRWSIGRDAGLPQLLVAERRFSFGALPLWEVVAEVLEGHLELDEWRPTWP